MASAKRRFGAVRKLPSGRFQARYLDSDGVMKAAPNTFARKEEANRWLTMTEAALVRGDWIDPSRGRILLKDYAERWINERPKLRPRTIALYRQLLRSHIVPKLGGITIGDLTTARIRSWRTELMAGGVSALVVAKAYRLLRAVLNTAVKEDELIRKNPCRIPGADKEESAERPVLTMVQVFALAKLLPEQFQAMVLVTTFACLRWGEVTALTRADIDLKARTVRVVNAYGEVEGSGLELGPTKSRAGRRTVSIPEAIVPTIRKHLDDFVPADPAALVFTGVSKARPPLRRNNFAKLVGWRTATAAVGSPGLHFHDLRHTGNTLAAATGASTRDLMTRMGHDSARAA